MRALIILAGAALTLSACGNNRQSDNSNNLDENLTAENIVANDVTAIDAVTADAANMAADVNYENELDNSLDNNVSALAPTNTTKPSKPRKPAASATENSAANTTD